MNPTMLNRGARVVAENPQLQIGAGAAVAPALLVCVTLLVVWSIGYERSDNC